MIHHSQRLDAHTIKISISPYDFYLREQELSHYGSRSQEWVVAGFCPFHDDHSPGSFKINLKNGAFVCFSCGTRGGDTIRFTELKYQIPFRQALEKLAYDWRVLC